LSLSETKTLHRVSEVYTEPDQVLTNAAELSQLKISSSDAARTLQTENERLESSAKELRQQLCEQKTSIKLAEDNEREANKLVQRREQEVGLLKGQLGEVIQQRNGLQRRIDEELQPHVKQLEEQVFKLTQEVENFGNDKLELSKSVDQLQSDQLNFNNGEVELSDKALEAIFG
jgi:chromosome segregation ATPase